MPSHLKPQTLQSAAQKYLPQTLAFLQDLVRLPSVNGRDSEAAVSQRIAQEAAHLGFQASTPALDPQRPNTLVEWGQGSAGFLLVGHIDTVSEGIPSAWKHPPFGAQIEGDILYGRGSGDNKAGIACGLYTLALLRDHALLDPSQVRLQVAGVVDEESGASSTLGMRHLLNQGLLQSARGAIYTYTSDIVCVGHRGLLRLILRSTGQPVHSGSPQWNRAEAGVNAVTGLADLLLRLEKLRLPSPRHPAFKGLTNKLTPGTIFRGGEFESMVPAAAEALIDIRLMPGQPPEEIIQIVQQQIQLVEKSRPGLRLSLEVKNQLPAVALPVAHPLVKTAQKWTRLITGQKWPAVGAGPANEGYMLMQAGIPTLPGFGPTGGNAHAPDEWVSISSLTNTIAMYAGIITDTL